MKLTIDSRVTTYDRFYETEPKTRNLSNFMKLLDLFSESHFHKVGNVKD